MRRRYIIREVKKHFECQRSGLCCKAPGFVFLTDKDIRKMAAFFKSDEAVFSEKYVLREDGDRILKKLEDDACIFLTPEGCQIQEVKPQQCREFPRRWRDSDAFDYCEGIRKVVEGMR